jgi:hypothetical protein
VVNGGDKFKLNEIIFLIGTVENCWFFSAHSATHVFGSTNRAFPLYAGSTAIGNGQGRSSSPELQINTNNTNFENLKTSQGAAVRLENK